MTAKIYFQKLKSHIDNLDCANIEKLVKLIWKTYLGNKQIFICGNGGSAATASHLAADIGKNVGLKIKTIALTDNIAWMTAVGNDLSYEDIFVEQLKNFANRGDVLIVISGSGNSANVIKAVDWANKHGLTTVGLLGFNGGKLRRKVKIAVIVKVNHYGYVEGIHSEIHHYLVEALKELKTNAKNLH